MKEVLLSTGFAILDEDIGGGIQRRNTTMIVAPPDFGLDEYAHYLVAMADHTERTTQRELPTVVVTTRPNVMPAVDAFADHVLVIENDLDPDQLTLRLEQLPVCPDIVFAIDISDEQAVALSRTVRQRSSLVLFAQSSAGPYDRRRPLHWVFNVAETVLHGEDNVKGKCWSLVKNKYGTIGTRVLVSARIKGDWEK